MTHRNAPLTPQGRYRLVMRVQAGRPIAHVAAEAGIARATLSKWVARYRQGGISELEDRSSAPFHCPTRTSAETVDLIEHWRRTHKWSARRISHELAVRGTMVSARTVTRWLDRAGLNRRRDIDPTGQTNRVIKPILARFPGHMIHLDVKKVGRIPPGGGWRAHGRGTPKAKASRRGKGARIGYTYLCAVSSLLRHVSVMTSETLARAGTRGRLVAQGARAAEGRGMTGRGCPWC